MKESVGEGSMTIVTIVIVSSAIAALSYVIYQLIDNQNKRANCENAGYSYYNGSCHNDLGAECTLNENDECE